jgi:uncharacterized protein (DUF2249 family)/hemerythrin-like domain-containing protein
MPVQLGARPQHGFDQPLGLLSDCHRRIENFLGVLRKVAASAQGSLDPRQKEVVEAALTYFRTAAPRHNDDEEKSLFPLLRNSSDRDVADAFKTMESLERDHAAAAPVHDEVDRLFIKWIDAGALPPEQKTRLTQLLDELTAMYQKHIEVEDRNLFPLAAKVLNAEQLARLSSEMAGRRGLTAPRPSTPTQGDRPVATTKTTIDVRTIPGPQRHPLIFSTFDGLQPGEALEIVNDHDPFPLHNQFSMMKRGQFNWEYLQQGPEVWQVRISRVKPAQG